MNFVLKSAILNTGLKQIYISKKIGIRNDRLSRIIHGHLQPRPEEKNALAKFIQKPVNELFPIGSMEDNKSRVKAQSSKE